MNTPHMRATVACLIMLGLTALLRGGVQDPQIDPQVFGSPDEAVLKLIDALRADDTGRLLKIMGSEGEQLVVSEDKLADQQRRTKFLAMYDQKHSVINEGDDSATLVLGKSDWPFPVPIVRGEKGWYFDAEEGQEEILNRRIGENELSAIQVCRAIGDAEHEYALRDPDNDGVHEYAQQFFSDPGKRNGLYWATAENEAPSPLGELAAEASAEGYSRKEGSPTPYHGYYYRILKAQGPHAPNGTLDYMANGKMILGFAVVAYPADYGETGIMTFITGDDGVVYQKDLGERTEELAREMKTFDPDPSWTKVD